MNELLLTKNKPVIVDGETLLRLDMQGNNGQNFVLDKSPNPKEALFRGQTVLSVSVVQYGTTACEVSYAGDSVVIAEAFPEGFKSGPWTFECYLRSCSAEAFAAIMTIGAQDTSGTGGIIVSKAGTFVGTSSGWVGGGQLFPFNWSECAWRHFACTYDLTTLNLYYQGSLKGSIAINANTLLMSDPKYLMLGKNYTNSMRFQGYFQDVRLTKGIRYTGSTYTLPAYPLQNI